MTSRERFVKTLCGEKVDRVPFFKVFGGENAAYQEWESECPGVKQNIDRWLGFEGRGRGWYRTPVNTMPEIPDKPELLSETETVATWREGDGTVVQKYKSGDYREHVIEWPIRTLADWHAYRDRFMDPDNPARFPENWAELAAGYRVREYPLELTHRGVYGFARERMGDQNLALAFYDQPQLVREMMRDYTDIAIAIWRRQLRDTDFDLVECWEDMASKNGSFISPKTFREFLAPCYRRIAAFAKEHGIRVILVDSDGLVEELTGLMHEAGVTALYPYEVLAGNDPARVRARWPEMGIIGGLRKEAMYEGREAIDREMARARALIKLGRCIPGPDHFALRAASFASYRYFMERLREVVMTTEPGG